MTMQNPNPQSAFVEAHLALKRRIAEGRPHDVPVGDAERRRRSLQTCHRYKTPGRPRCAPQAESRGYVPELAALIDNDPNLTDGARRCARKIAEETYRRNRDGRSLAVTVTYLARTLGRCRRTVQRYLRQLEDGGYIAVDVIASHRTRMSIGLVVSLLTPLFAAHHRERWPGARGNPGATQESQIQRSIDSYTRQGRRIPVQDWALRCMDGVFRALMATRPLAGPPVLLGR